MAFYLPREKEVLGAAGRCLEWEARAQMGLLLGFFGEREGDK